ncbi:arsenate reductase (glutaredoxin) [Stenoxybacter acetivorans]|uniref:arsenate reductase (glutaredoxin) n=1 Tax=Stenoxybacter acetivorans TaxID=422441 RepID=UPI000561B3D9|nr:arsenate reductase (glutaredoxin) [Stenoxybacter acetivorans]
MITIYHNPRCTKSCAALARLQEYAQENDVQLCLRTYLQETPDEAEIHRLLNQLGVKSAREMMRTGEAVYQEQHLDKADEDALIAAMVAYPILIERPIVVYGGKAVIARPLDHLERLLP